MLNTVLSYLNKSNTHGLLCPLIALGYLAKGQGIVNVKYHKIFQAWEFRVKNISYLSPGPGWAYTFDYLNQNLNNYFSFYYQVKEGDTVIDLGAGLGEETLIFAQMVGNNGKVYAIEANPKVAKALDYAIKRNSYGNVEVLNKGIDEKKGTLKVEDTIGYVSNTTFKSEESTSTCFEVDCYSFDDFVNEKKLGTIDFLKVNIEGAEQFLIKGMANSISMIKNVAISCHDFRTDLNGESSFYKTKEIIKKFFTENNFEVSVRNTDNPLIDNIVYGKNLTYIS